MTPRNTFSRPGLLGLALGALGTLLGSSQAHAFNHAGNARLLASDEAAAIKKPVLGLQRSAVPLAWGFALDTSVLADAALAPNLGLRWGLEAGPHRFVIGARSVNPDFKIKVVGKWLKAHGASPNQPATVGIGISLDEIERVNNRRAMPYEHPVYPLLDHNPPLRRYDCETIIRAAGLPVPAKSACWFCPFRLCFSAHSAWCFSASFNLRSSLPQTA